MALSLCIVIYDCHRDRSVNHDVVRLPLLYLRIVLPFAILTLAAQSLL